MTEPYIIYTESLSGQVGFDGAAICAKVMSYADENGVAHISLSYLAKIGCMSVDSLRRLIYRLQALGYIEYRPAYGRGNLPEFKKGSKIQPFIEQKRSQNCLKKGSKMRPKNKNINIDRLDKNAPVRVNKQSKKMEPDFLLFLDLFFSGSYAKKRQEQEPYIERAHNVWLLMHADTRKACIKELQNKKRYDKTYWVLYYLQHYKEPLPIWFDGDAYLTPQTLKNLVRIKYQNKWAYCTPESVQKCVARGAQVL